jgi:hypothetical protein
MSLLMDPASRAYPFLSSPSNSPSITVDYKKKNSCNRNCAPPPTPPCLPHAFHQTSSPPLSRPHRRGVLPHDRTAAAASPREAARTRLLLSPPPRAPLAGGSATTHRGPHSRPPAAILLLHRDCTGGSRYAVLRPPSCQVLLKVVTSQVFA